ncbi:MAG: DUF72 domain-containing protein [Gemmatimonadales bacterium]|nr:DUF72 domain-containing protein [Gemmatimonadales bacterium]
MNILVGTSGWSYKEWKGSFYPPKLPAEEMLRFYAGHFSVVEVNNSFYRIPAERVLAGWAEQVPPGFRFVMKASRRVTHNNRLSDEDGSLGYFLRAVNPLGDRLGPTLFQLPPTFKKNIDRLREFLDKLPRRWPAALEFRHPSWFVDEVYDTLRVRDVALVAVDDDDMAGTGSPLVPTASWGYIRLRRSGYDEASLGSWASRIRSTPWSDAYVFLKHEDGSPTGPAAAAQLQATLADLSQT